MHGVLRLTVKVLRDHECSNTMRRFLTLATCFLPSANCVQTRRKLSGLVTVGGLYRKTITGAKSILMHRLIIHHACKRCICNAILLA